MKKGIHPESYRVVVFKDMSDGTQFFSRSTAATKDSIEIDGTTYPLIKLEISNTSHPFYTGKSKLVDTAGRVDKFMSRYGNRRKYSYNCERRASARFFYPCCLDAVKLLFSCSVALCACLEVTSELLNP